MDEFPNLITFLLLHREKRDYQPKERTRVVGVRRMIQILWEGQRREFKGEGSLILLNVLECLKELETWSV